MNGQPQGRHLVIVGSDAEGAVALVGFLVDLILVVEKLLGQPFGVGGSRQVKSGGLEEHLESADEVGLAETDIAAFPGHLVPVGEVDTGDGADVVGLVVQQIDDRLPEAGGVDKEVGGVGALLTDATGDLVEALSDGRVGGSDRQPFQVTHQEVPVVSLTLLPLVDLDDAEGRGVSVLSSPALGNDVVGA